MTYDRDLIHKAAILARTSPENWKQFLGALAPYVEQQRDACIKSPIEALPVAQGRAQFASHLFGLLAECLSLADKFKEKNK